MDQDPVSVEKDQDPLEGTGEKDLVQVIETEKDGRGNIDQDHILEIEIMKHVIGKENETEIEIMNDHIAGKEIMTDLVIETVKGSEIDIMMIVIVSENVENGLMKEQQLEKNGQSEKKEEKGIEIETGREKEKGNEKERGRFDQEKKENRHPIDLLDTKFLTWNMIFENG